MESSCTRFTAAEGGARLAACAGSKNILVTEHTAFISTSVLVEHAHKIRGPLSSGRQRSVYVTRSSRTECVSHELTILTNLSVVRACLYDDVGDWKQELEEKEVLVCTSVVLKTILEKQIITIPDINVLIIDSCHLIFKDQNLQYIMKLYKQCEENKPRILALTYPLFTAPKDVNEETYNNSDNEDNTDDKNVNSEEKDSNKDVKDICVIEEETNPENDVKDVRIEKEKEAKIEVRVTAIGSYDNMDDFNVYEKLEWKIEELEKELCCDMDLAEDIDGGKRLSATLTKPKELIVEYKPKLSTEVLPEHYVDLEDYMRSTVNDALDFIDEHRYDPTEIYGEDMYEEFANIPDPTADPKHILQEFLYVLDQLGPYAADKAAFSLLIKLEKLKIKVPYERHFLLLCLCTSVFVKIRCYGDLLFSTYTSEWEKIASFSTPKVLRLAEILEQFQPPENLNQIDSRNVLDTTRHKSDSTNFDSKEKNEKDSTNSNTCKPGSIDVINDDSKTDILTVNIQNNEKNEKDTVNSNSKRSIDVNNDDSKTDLSENIRKNERDTANSNSKTSIDVNNDDSKTDILTVNIQNAKTNECYSKNDGNEDINPGIKRSKATELLSAIEKCDFITLSNKIEDKVNTYEANLKDLEEFDNCETNINIVDIENKSSEIIDNEIDVNSVNEDSFTEVVNSKNGESTNNDSEIVNKHSENQYSVNSANKDSGNIVDSVNKDSGNIVDSVNKDSRNIVDSVNKDSGNIVDSANKDNGNIVNSVYKDSGNTVDSVNKDSGNIVDSVNKDSGNIIDSFKKDSENIVDSVNKDSGNIVDSVNKDSGNIVDSVNKDSGNIVESVNKDSGKIVDSGIKDSERNVSDTVKVGFGKRPGHRSRGRGRVQRGNATKIQQLQQNPDALCGIIFVKEALMAKIMFMMIVDMSRSRLSLSHLCVQYCASDGAGEGKDCQREGKKQEDVLKKFRMHECNLLLATSVLEEGIDLPRCNLVVRWDVPPSYRSHGLCRGRARAPRASVALLACSEAHSGALVHNLAVYKELDQIITRKCGCGIQYEPSQEEENHADSVSFIVKPYTPVAVVRNDSSSDIKYEDTRIDYDNKLNCVEKHDKLQKSDSTDDSEHINNNKCSEKAVEVIQDDITKHICNSFDVIVVNVDVNSGLNAADNSSSIKSEIIHKNLILIEKTPTDMPHNTQSPNADTPNMAVNLNRLNKHEKDLLNLNEFITKEFNINRNLHNDNATNNVISHNSDRHIDVNDTEASVAYDKNYCKNEMVDKLVEMNKDCNELELGIDGIDDNTEVVKDFDEINKDKKENLLQKDRINIQKVDIVTEITADYNESELEGDSINKSERQDKNDSDKVNKLIEEMNEDHNERESERDETIKSMIQDKNDCYNEVVDKLSEINKVYNEHELERDRVNKSEMHDKMDCNINTVDKLTQIKEQSNESELERDETIKSKTQDKNDCYNEVVDKLSDINEVYNEHVLERDAIGTSERHNEKDNKLSEINSVHIGNNETCMSHIIPHNNNKKDGIHASENIVKNQGKNGKEADASHEELDLNMSSKFGEENVRYEDIKFEYKLNDCKKTDDNIASVDLNSAIALINRYCGKLPSDTFTRLAPQWWMEGVRLPDRRGEMKTAYICTLRMPLNCPVKYNIVGHPMPTRVLARRMVALQACRILHKSGELDNQLMPIGKENFKAAELESQVSCTEPTDPADCARPGTTKRRQYYYKRTAWAFTDCQAIIDATDSDVENNPIPDNPTATVTKGSNILYALVSRLWCALPERYNTRGRRLHAPQHAPQAIGVLMARREPTQLQIPAFPVYTRSGEVRVSVEPALEADVRLSPRRARLIRRFMRFVFSDVLRVRRRGMKLQMEGSTHNNYYIVPTIKKTRSDGSSWIDVDWPFLELIYKHTEEKKNLEVEKPIIWEQEEKKKEKEKDGKVRKMENPLLKNGEVFTFDPEKYKEAVVTPWYRNQDQPQFFLVAEICWKLSPDSAFPSAQHASFRSYYRAKYGAELTQSCQPLLDVDHTSARLNLLTPRYVNRKGVALPVSSERTRRAKRDRLDQKQILVPELCRVHPFAAPLWFATVALPCVLYRINALLIADEIRRAVAIDVGLGIPRIDDQTCPGFQWPALDFGWSLAEVLSADSEKLDKKKEDEQTKHDENNEEIVEKEQKESIEEKKEEGKEKTINDILQEKLEAESGFEIGTWSNDMASSIPQLEYDEFLEPLPSNLTFCTSSSGGANWSEPIEKPKGQFNPTRAYSMADSDCSYVSSDFDTDDSDLTDCSDDDTDTSGFCSSRNSNAAMGVRIEYKTAHEAEAVDLERRKPIAPAPQPDKLDDERDLKEYKHILRAGVPPKEYIDNFRKSVARHENDIKENGHLITKDNPIVDLLPEPSRDIDRYHNHLPFKDKVGKHSKDNEAQTVMIPKQKEHFRVNDLDKTKRIDKDKLICDNEENTDSQNDLKDRLNIKIILENNSSDIINEEKVVETTPSVDNKNIINDIKLEVNKINEEMSIKAEFLHKNELLNNADEVTDTKRTDDVIKKYTVEDISPSKNENEEINSKTLLQNDFVNDAGQVTDTKTTDDVTKNNTIEHIFPSKNENEEMNSKTQLLQNKFANNAEQITDTKPTDDVTKKNTTEDIFPCKNENEQINSKTQLLQNDFVNNAEVTVTKTTDDLTIKNTIADIFPYKNGVELQNEQITLESIERNKRYLLAELKKSLPEEEIKRLNCFSMKDIDIDSPEYINEKVVNVGFDSKEKYQEKVNTWSDGKEYKPYYMEGSGQNGTDFDFDYQPDLEGHPGPSPSVILQALTMSNANDGINLERLETIGDSFLKFAITAYLYCAHPAVHEGKLSHMRSKQVSNLNLYRLGRNKRLGARMIASKFEPHDNWLPPCHRPPPTLQPTRPTDAREPLPSLEAPVDSAGCFIPYNLITQHSIPDKSIADCVEALIGAYLLECGPRGALLFMSWLGIRVLPRHMLPLPDSHPYVVRASAERVEESKIVQRPPPSKPVEPISSDSCCSDDEEVDPELNAPEPDWSWAGRPVGALRPYQDRDGKWMQPIFGELKAPPSPLLRYIEDPEGELEQMLSGYDALERTLQYRFRDRSLLLQALTHASHQKNRLTDCYQRLEFLGDAILDYLITRHLYEDPRRHSPGALTDLRSALVNNTIFATLAARHGFHKYFRHMSPGLNEVLTKYVKIQEENGHSISEEHYLIQEDEMEQAEDVEVPKALGDLFESVAGAIFLDSGMSLGAVWRSVGALLGAELDAFSAAAPKSPVRELLEAEPDTAKFGKPERLADGRRVRVCVEVFGRGAFKGIGRNYRIAKGTAARCALRHLRSHRPR